MASQSLVWKGEVVTARMKAAQVAGIDSVMSSDTDGSCVKTAKNNHEWQNQSVTLEGSIGVAQPATADATGFKGIWGSQDVEYALIHELGGTIKHPGGTAYFIGEDGMAVFVEKDDPRAPDLPKTKPHDIVIPARPYLRPAADLHYPSLADRIRKAYDKSAPGKGGASG